MKSIHISNGKVYRKLSPSDKYYLKKTTKFIDKIWVYFSWIEDDFRLLHMPMGK